MIMALSSFLNINGYDFPIPDEGFSYAIATTTNSVTTANNATIGQRVGRDLFKFNTLQWTNLDPEQWKMMLEALKEHYVPVTFEDYRTGKPITITMYPGDRNGQPLFVDKLTHQVTKYRSCKFNLIDAGLE